MRDKVHESSGARKVSDRVLVLSAEGDGLHVATIKNLQSPLAILMFVRAFEPLQPLLSDPDPMLFKKGQSLTKVASVW